MLHTKTAQWTQPGYTVTTDVDRFDLEVIHKYLSEVAYWSIGVPRATVERATRNSLAFGLFEAERQIGLARLITDLTTFAYLSDVFVLPEHQGKGLGTWFMECVFAHPDLASMRRLMLVTGDAQKLYEKFGFTALANPEQVMEKRPQAALRPAQ
jgi:GNAT superfamily N-acetyltransferase